jgi:hypothetical protein
MPTVRESSVFMANDLAVNIFNNNAFMMKAINDDRYIAGSKVILPQAGAIPSGKRNRTQFPIPVVRRTDSTIEYAIDSFSTDANHIRYSDQISSPHNMNDTTIQDHQNTLTDMVAEGILYGWSPTAAAGAANIFRTSGAARLAISTGATGNRKKTVKLDILKIKRKMDKDKIPSQNRQILFDTEMLNDLLEDTGLLGSFEAGEYLAVYGELKRLFNFEVDMRAQMLRYTSGLVKIDKNADNYTGGSATDHCGAIAWHPNYVRQAFAGAKVFLDLNNPVYQGDLMSAEVFAGGAPRYSSLIGVYALVEDVAA